jgi:hypothetical protein
MGAKDTKKCTACEKFLPRTTTYFAQFQMSNGQLYFRSKCRECLRAYDHNRTKTYKRTPYAELSEEQKAERRLAVKNSRRPSDEISHSQKYRVLEVYGLSCQCCGDEHFEFLTIDHIEGGGAAHRRKVHNFYSWVIRNNFPPGFRTLCMNCNFADGKYGYCPHELERTALESNNPATVDTQQRRGIEESAQPSVE